MKNVHFLVSFNTRYQINIVDYFLRILITIHALIHTGKNKNKSYISASVLPVNLNMSNKTNSQVPNTYVHCSISGPAFGGGGSRHFNACAVAAGCDDAV